ncbi:MAG: hypothetical protein RIS80_279 [Actinomycetota bacterium]
MRILGIDPGLTRCGIGVVDIDKQRKCTMVHVSTAKSAASDELQDRIGQLATAIEEAITTHKPERIALERVFAQANLRTVMGVAQISGVVLLLAQRHGIPLSFYTPSEVKAAVTGSGREVKAAVTGSGRAEKAQIGTMVTKILGLSETPKPADAADALAIAITCGWKSYSPSGTLPTTKATETWQKAIAAAANRKRS